MLDTQGFAAERFNPAPAVGVHPRVLFGPKDLPGIRQRLKSTKAGQVIWANVNKVLEKDLTGPNAKFGRLYDDLAAGKEVPDAWARSWHVAFEALRCLIEEDAAGLKKAAAATVTLAKIVEPGLDKEIGNSDWTRVEKVINQQLGHLYDWTYNAMTKQQRDYVRSVISKGTYGKRFPEMGSLPAWAASTTNHIALIGESILYTTMAIEGEEGYDQEVYTQYEELMKNYIGRALLDSGAPFEGGFGKFYIGGTVLGGFARRGNQMFCMPQLKRYLDEYHLYTMQPFGQGYFSGDASWAGSLSSAKFDDIAPMKFAFPENRAIDFIYRTIAGEDYERLPKRIDGGYHAKAALAMIVYGDDYLDYGKPGRTWEKQLAEVSAGRSVDRFFNDRGLLISRSDWSTDAAQLVFQPRSVPGGHTYADRNYFTLTSHGRVWAEYPVMDRGSFMGTIYEGRFHNTVLIDDIGQSVLHTPTGRVLDYQYSDAGAFLVGDAKDAYDFQLSRDEDARPIPRTPNDTRLYKSDLPWMDLPWGQLPNWQNSFKNSNVGTPQSFWKPWYPVKKAIRTAGLVRGKHPYVLVLDDIQKDKKVRVYKWLMQVPDDVYVQSMIITDTESRKVAPNYRGPKPNYVSDIVLAEDPDIKTASKGDPTHNGKRRLLVRVLDNQQIPNERYRQNQTFTGMPAVLETYMKNPRWHAPGKRLVIPSRSTSPDYKVLLFPHIDGQELPVTLWNKDRTKLTVKWNDQIDEFTFSKSESGRTLFTLTRDGKEVIKIK
ncbi:MAG: hypothetical protein AAGH99_09640 [Planctomycetota bacterium]